jgi:hypothetical protein
MDKPMQGDTNETGFSAKNQVAIMLYFFRQFGKCKSTYNFSNIYFVMNFKILNLFKGF